MKLIRPLVCIVAFSLATAGEPLTAEAQGAVDDQVAAGLQLLQGRWEGSDSSGRPGEKITITITGDSLHFHRDADFWFETTFTLPVGKVPKQLRATIKDAPPSGKDSIGKVVSAIFKIEDGKLTILPLSSGAEETPQTFEITEDSGQSRYELRRAPLKQEAKKGK
jgi:uncharacterized protein (TIGR03067 family)